MKSLSSFMGSALSRAEMKNVTGGQCYVNDGAGGRPVNGLKAAKAEARKDGVNYCCDSCYKATWFSLNSPHQDWD